MPRDATGARERPIMGVIRGNRTSLLRGGEGEPARAWAEVAIAGWNRAGRPALRHRLDGS